MGKPVVVKNHLLKGVRVGQTELRFSKAPERTGKKEETGRKKTAQTG
jgi:hypothetical protein